jgi:hypothetical protein
MAIYTVSFAGVTTGTALKTIAQIAAAAGDRLEIIEWSLSFNGTSASAVPVLVQLNRQTSAGTGGVSATPALQDLGDAASGTTGLTGPLAATWTAEPTAGTIIYQDYYTPVGLGPAWQYPLGRGIIVPLSGRMGIVVTAAVAINCAGHFVFNEG